MGLDIHVHDTYFVVAHFHYIMVGGAIMGYLGGLHYWWPKITGRLYPEAWARFAAMHRLRRLQPDVLPAVPRRLPRACRGATTMYPPEFQVFNVLLDAPAPRSWRSATSMPMVYFTYSMFKGENAPGGSLGRARAGMGDPLAAADGELPRDAHRDARHASVRVQRGGRHCLNAHSEHYPGPIHQPPVAIQTGAPMRTGTPASSEAAAPFR